jgi:hypothetical protein
VSERLSPAEFFRLARRGVEPEAPVPVVNDSGLVVRGGEVVEPGPNDHRAEEIAERRAGRRAKEVPPPVWTDADRRASAGAFAYFSPRARKQSYGSRQAQGYMRMGRRESVPDDFGLRPHNYIPREPWRL